MRASTQTDHPAPYPTTVRAADPHPPVVALPGAQHKLGPAVSHGAWRAITPVMGPVQGCHPSGDTGSAGLRSWRAEHRDRGASLVEFAIVLPVLALLLFGVIEFGLTLNDYQSVRQGAREGARNAVVEDFGTVTSCSLNGGAATAPDNAKRVICMTKASVGLSDVRVRIDFTDTNPGFVNDKLQVCVTRQVNSITGLFQPFLSGVNLRTQIEMRAEKELPLPNGVTAEIDPSGDNWSWC